MKTILHSGMSVGWTPNRFKNERLSACFFVKLGLRLRPGAAAELADEPPGVVGDVFEEDDPAKPLVVASDFVPFKPRTDVVVKATAHAPGGHPVRSFEAAIGVGEWSKTVRVFGPRQWKSGMLGRSGVLAAEPFVDLPITYEHAMGGGKSKINPVGMGVDGELAPRIEDAARPITAPDAKLAPAGFGPIPNAWEPRAGGRGTYGKRWRAERWPWLPDDFDYGTFNSAPRDQQLDKRPRGDEELRFENLRADRSSYRTRLPGLRVRAFVVIRETQEFREIPLEIDTLWIDVTAETATMTARGAIEVRTPKLREIDAFLAWVEPLAEPKRPIAHYQAMYAEKIKTAPDVPAPTAPPTVDAGEALDRELEASLKEMEALEAQAAAARPPDVALPAEPGSLTAADVKAALAALGDLEPAQRSFYESEITALASMQADFDAMEKEFDAEFVAAPGVDELCARAAAGESLGGLNLAKYDFSGRPLAGVDFRRSKLTGANFAGADLRRARFDEADLSKADLSGADLRGGTLDGADLTGAKLDGAKLLELSASKATLVGMNLAGADLTGLRAEAADFREANLAGANLSAAFLKSVDFAKATLESANFREADLTRAKMAGVKAAGASFEKATLDFARTGDKAAFAKANFREVRARSAVFEGVTLDGADFSRGRLPRALFGDASLRAAILDRADLAGAMFDDADLTGAKLTNANLLRATFERADLQDASLEGSNGYEAGFWEANVANAKLERARLTHTLLG